MATQKKPKAVPIEIVVRRGAIRRFHKLTQKTESLPVAVKWDRRLADRRGSTSSSPANRRSTDRRQPPPFTWEMSDFVVVAKSQKRDMVARPQKRAPRAAGKSKAS